MEIKAYAFPKRMNYLVFLVFMAYLTPQLILAYTLGNEWLERNFYFSVIINELVIILLPVLLFVYYHGMNPVAAFRLKRITALEALLVVMMAVSSSLIASVLNSFVFFFLDKIGPVHLDSIPSPGNVSELWLQIAVIAILPAICEELFFRGVLFTAFEELGARMTIFASALYFALFHFDIRNLLGPFFLGLLIAWYCFRTGSIFAGILAHLTNNLLAVLISWYNRGVDTSNLDLTPDTMAQLILLASAMGIILVILMKAFAAITKGKVPLQKMAVKKATPRILAHWPMLLIYAAYLVVVVLYISSLTKPLA